MSDVARCMRQIDLEREAWQNALSGFGLWSIQARFHRGASKTGSRPYFAAHRRRQT